MKTKTNARILAWLLSICLIAGISPAMPTNYAKAAPGDVITYNFVSSNGDQNFFTSGGTWSERETLEGTLNPKFANFDHVAEGEGKWKYFSHPYSVNKAEHFRQSAAYGLYIQVNGGNAPDGYSHYQLLIYFDGSGDFSVDANVGYWDSCANTAKLSLIPCDETGSNQGDTIDLGTIDYRKQSSKDGIWNVPTHIGKVSSLREGYYILDIGCAYNKVTVDGSTKNLMVTIIGALNFTELDPPPAAPITYNFVSSNGDQNFFTSGGTWSERETLNGTLNPKFANFDHVAEGEGKWKYFSHPYSVNNVADFKQSAAYGLYIKVNGGNAPDGYSHYQLLIYFDGNGDFSVDANVGYWDSCANTAKLSLIPCDETGGNQKTAIDLGTIDYRKCSSTSGIWNVPSHIGEVSSLQKGYYILDIGCAYNKVTVNGSEKKLMTTIIGALTFNPLSADNKVFIDKGAYITENADGTYKVTFLSAIDSLNYKGVGFKVSKNEGSMSKAQDMGDAGADVYESVVVNNSATQSDETVYVASFGLDEGYVFFDSLDNVAAGSIISFQPYAIDLNGYEILGKTFTAQIN